MVDKIKEYGKYLALLTAIFWLFPLAVTDTGIAMLVMLAVMPIAVFTVAVDCGMRKGLHGFLPAATIVIFLPTVWIYYNVSAWIYAPIYSVIVAAGCFFGRFFSDRR